MYILFRLTSIWRYHVVATINIEHNVRVLTLLDLVYQVMVFLRHHLSEQTMYTRDVCIMILIHELLCLTYHMNIYFSHVFGNISYLPK